jgi:hypothetical protein
MTNCQARHSGVDEMHCATCHLRWDVSDPEPPLCGRECPSIVPGNAPVQVATRDEQERLPYASGLAPDIFSPRPKIVR